MNEYVYSQTTAATTVQCTTSFMIVMHISFLLFYLWKIVPIYSYCSWRSWWSDLVSATCAHSRTLLRHIHFWTLSTMTNARNW